MLECFEFYTMFIFVWRRLCCTRFRLGRVRACLLCVDVILIEGYYFRGGDVHRLSCAFIGM